MNDSLPEKVPKKGEFYYHYKHDPSLLEDHAYEIIGTAFHTEEENQLVLYRPLYGDRAYLNGADMCARPLSMWFEEVTKGGKTFPRFAKITDPAVIKELEAKRAEMYGE